MNSWFRLQIVYKQLFIYSTNSQSFSNVAAQQLLQQKWQNSKVTQLIVYYYAKTSGRWSIRMLGNVQERLAIIISYRALLFVVFDKVMIGRGDSKRLILRGTEQISLLRVDSCSKKRRLSAFVDLKCRLIKIVSREIPPISFRVISPVMNCLSCWILNYTIARY